MYASSPILTKTVGTVCYAAPELLVQGLLTRAADVYSFGAPADDWAPPVSGMAGAAAAGLSFSTCDCAAHAQGCTLKPCLPASSVLPSESPCL